MWGQQPTSRPEPEVRLQEQCPGCLPTTPAPPAKDARSSGSRLPALRPRWLEVLGVGRRRRRCPSRGRVRMPHFPVAIPVRTVLPRPGSHRMKGRNYLPPQPLVRSYCKSRSPSHVHRIRAKPSLSITAHTVLSGDFVDLGDFIHNRPSRGGQGLGSRGEKYEILCNYVTLCDIQLRRRCLTGRCLGKFASFAPALALNLCLFASLCVIS